MVVFIGMRMPNRRQEIVTVGSSPTLTNQTIYKILATYKSA